MKKIVLIWLAKIVFALLIAFLAGRLVPYKGFFPYGEKLPFYRLPNFIAALANFDGLHYLAIAEEGYHQYEQAFFPLYPLLIRVFSFWLSNGLVVGLAISNASFLVGLYFFYKLTKMITPDINSLRPTILLALFPTAFFFNALYTESLFFMLAVLSLFFLKKNRLWPASICAALSSAARLMGIFLFLPFLIYLLKSKPRRRWLFAFSPFLGFFAYMIYLWSSTGDPLFFLHAQTAFGANRSSSIVLLPQVYFRYLKIFATAQPNFQYAVALAEFFIFTMIFAICVHDLINSLRVRKYWHVSLVIFSLINILLPAATGTFSSIPRYGLLSFSVYFYLARVKNVWTRSLIVIFFAIGQIILLSLFIQGYFVS